MEVLVADRHPLFREVLRGVIAEAAPQARCIEAQTFADTVDLAKGAERLRLLVLDLAVEGMDGLTGLLRLAMLKPQVPVVVVSAIDSADLAGRTVVCGAAGFLPKSMAREDMLGAIRSVLAGDTGRLARHTEAGERLDILTARERMVFEALVRGRSNKQIAYELEVTATTVKAHVSAVLRKLRVHSRTQAVIRARRLEGADA